MLTDMYLPKFDIYQSTVVSNCFTSHTKSSSPDFFFLKEVLTVYVRSEIRFVQANISTGQYARG